MSNLEDSFEDMVERAGRPGGNSGAFLLLLLVITTTFLCNSACFAEVQAEDAYVQTQPFVPQTTDYALEIGTMWEKRSLYWLSGLLGFHIGPCVFSPSQTCQQYVDIIFGGGGREADTHGLLLGSLRWQWVNFPSSWSPTARLFVGAHNVHEGGELSVFPTYGVGLGTVTYLHDQVDLRLELRVAQGRQVWTQAFIGLQLKMDRLVDYFANKLKEIGLGTAEVTGTVIKGTLKTTGEGIGTVIQSGGRAMEKAIDATGKVIQAPFDSNQENDDGLTDDQKNPQPEAGDDAQTSPKGSH